MRLRAGHAAIHALKFPAQNISVILKLKVSTPFQINIAQDNKISICAYSGCWSGQLNSTKHLHLTSYSTQTLTWNEHTSKAEAFLLGIDTRNHTGFLLGEGFSLPLNCTPE